MVAAAGRPGSSVTVKSVGLNERRTALMDVLRRMGAGVEVVMSGSSEDREPCGDVTVKGTKLKATVVGGTEIPNLIDELPLVAVAGALAEGTTVIRDARELRVKESDRIACMASNLKLMGVEVTEREDGMEIVGPAKLRPSGGVRSYGDHRIAMAMTVLAFHGSEPTCVNNIACIETSYPAFWDDMKRLGANVE
jgi:3-phosphoshikimate 1-carboxyvinyltransferase